MAKEIIVLTRPDDFGVNNLYLYVDGKHVTTHFTEDTGEDLIKSLAFIAGFTLKFGTYREDDDDDELFPIEKLEDALDGELEVHHEEP